MKDVTACWPTPFPPKKKQDASSVFANPTFFLKHWNQQDSLKRISPETHRKNGHFENVQAFLGQKGRNLSGVGATFIFQVRLPPTSQGGRSISVVLAPKDLSDMKKPVEQLELKYTPESDHFGKHHFHVPC